MIVAVGRAHDNHLTWRRGASCHPGSGTWSGKLPGRGDRGRYRCHPQRRSPVRPGHKRQLIGVKLSPRTMTLLTTWSLV